MLYRQKQNGGSRLEHAPRYSGLADHGLEGADANLRVIRYGHGDRGRR